MQGRELFVAYWWGERKGKRKKRAGRRQSRINLFHYPKQTCKNNITCTLVLFANDKHFCTHISEFGPLACCLWVWPLFVLHFRNYLNWKITTNWWAWSLRQQMNVKIPLPMIWIKFNWIICTYTCSEGSCKFVLRIQHIPVILWQTVQCVPCLSPFDSWDKWISC